MKLRNKKTGEITTNYDLLALQGVDIDKGINRICLQTEEGDKYAYSSLADFNADWEDYKEPKGYFFIRDGGNIDYNLYGKSIIERHKEIGNYFETKEEAEKAVEKLKAWKRLKDKGFQFDGWTIDDGLKVSICTNTDSEGIYDDDNKKDFKKDLDLLFGGEE